MYEYDVFISYHRDSPTVPGWIRSHFYPRLCEVLDDTVDYDVKVFFDEEISGGSEWPTQLRNALQRARLLLPVLSPKYFSDPWCVAEWHSMAKREELSPDRSEGLIYPVIFSDSENFPLWAKTRRMRNLRPWNLPLLQFADSQKYIDFYTELQRTAEELAPLIEQAPMWCPDWPVRTPPPEPIKRLRMPRL